MEDKPNSRFSSKPVTRARCVLSVLAVVMYHTNTITPTNATTLFPGANFSSRVKRDNEDPTHSCPLQLPTEVLQCVVGCAGVGISSVAMAQVTRGKHLNRPFRVLLSSLTVTDLAFSGSSFLLGSFAMYLSFDQDLQSLCRFFLCVPGFAALWELSEFSWQAGVGYPDDVACPSQ
ncbi:hypothetical protein ACOMHN_044069 [Nucella lapillus]